MASHYDTLGVAPGSTTQEIRKAYLRRARALHPDRQLGRTPTEARKAEQAMQQVNVAWNVLSDQGKKSEYDKAMRSRTSPASPRQAHPRATTTGPQTRPVAQSRSAASTGSAQSRSTPSGRSIDDEPGDGSVSVWASLPVLLILGLVLGILIVVAFAGNKNEPPRAPIVEDNAELGVGDCFALVGESPRQRSCAAGTADGQVVELGPEPGNCPENTQSLKDPNSEFFLCWARMIPGSSNTVPGG